ncbi:MAG: FAD-containing monooxygenase EthA, partial [Solirubrobacterales bacterium]
DQRVCLVPDGDFFRSIRKQKASIVTDEIETFTETGIQLKSGETIEADAIVTATGLNLKFLGGASVRIDGEIVELADRVSYNGSMLSGLPNAAYTVGYTNASWTLKADLVSKYVCRLINYMDDHNYNVCTPQPPNPSAKLEPIIDFSSGYVLRSVDKLPKQGDKKPWRLHQNYPLDVLMFKRGSLTDGTMKFDRVTPRTEQVSAAVAATG